MYFVNIYTIITYTSAEFVTSQYSAIVCVCDGVDVCECVCCPLQ